MRNRPQTTVFRAMLLALLLAGLAKTQQTPPTTQSSQSAQPQSPAQAQSAPASTETPTVLKVTSRLVVVDVVALDRKDQPVTDLKPEDFTLLEEGKEQKVRSFSFQHPVSAGEADGAQGGKQSAAVIPAKLPPNMFTNIPMYRANGALNVLLLDGLNTKRTNQIYAREEMIKFLEKLPAGQPVAVYALGARLHLLQDFTTDPSLLKSAIKAMKDHNSPVLKNATGGAESPFLTPAATEVLPQQVVQQMLAFEREDVSNLTDLRVTMTLNMLDSLSRTLAGHSGRKNLIWVSESFPVLIVPGVTDSPSSAATRTDQRDYTLAVARTANRLTDAQVAVYPIDARGLVNNTVYSNLSNTSSTGDDLGRTLSTARGMGRELDQTSDELMNARNTMNELAERTGGKAYYNHNELDSAIAKSFEDGSTYYTLTYSPENKDWTGKFRKISVKTSRAGVKLRYRSGYFAFDPQSYAKVDDRHRAMEFGLALNLDYPVSTALLFRVKVLPPSEITKNQVVINYAIDPHAVSFEEQPDGLQHAAVECAAEVYSTQGKTIKTEGDGINAALAPDVFKKVMQTFLPCSQKFSLAPGDYVLRVGVRDNRTGLIGTANATLTVPASTGAKTEDQKPR
ncbi:MAG TPA: VWA domain-containing protein [Verrucomicrobiae bacterium]|jgi:VWFA-related protein|nr:VWA domain-containing protein [Verrucomicrobiae bacterium]